MIFSGVRPDTGTIYIMLAGLCSTEELQKVLAILEDLQKSEVCPRLICFSNLLTFILGFGEVFTELSKSNLRYRFRLTLSD